MNCFPRDQSLSDLLHSTKRKTCNSNGCCRSTFAGNSALLRSDVIDFALLPAQRLLAGNNFRCHDLEVTNIPLHVWILKTSLPIANFGA